MLGARTTWTSFDKPCQPTECNMATALQQGIASISSLLRKSTSLILYRLTNPLSTWAKIGTYMPSRTGPTIHRNRRVYSCSLWGQTEIVDCWMRWKKQRVTRETSQPLITSTLRTYLVTDWVLSTRPRITNSVELSPPTRLWTPGPMLPGHIGKGYAKSRTSHRPHSNGYSGVVPGRTICKIFYRKSFDIINHSEAHTFRQPRKVI